MNDPISLRTILGAISFGISLLALAVQGALLMVPPPSASVSYSPPSFYSPDALPAALDTATPAAESPRELAQRLLAALQSGSRADFQDLVADHRDRAEVRLKLSEAGLDGDNFIAMASVLGAGSFYTLRSTATKDGFRWSDFEIESLEVDDTGAGALDSAGVELHLKSAEGSHRLVIRECIRVERGWVLANAMVLTTAENPDLDG